MSSEALADVLRRSTAAVLFDVDGPICDVFRGLSALRVAAELADLVVAHSPSLAVRARGTDDPMEVHRLSQGGGEALLGVVEAALTAAEVRAVKVAGPPVAGAVQALNAARHSKLRVAIVSNNSAECVNEFLALNGLGGVADAVIGRPVLRPDLMKPAPYPLLSAAVPWAWSPRTRCSSGTVGTPPTRRFVACRTPREAPTAPGRQMRLQY
jgi:phosphoglycolate phosphatase-like HAD superfamily hydrolase